MKSHAPAYLTLLVDGCHYVEPPGAVAHGSLSSLPDLVAFEEDEWAAIRIWPEAGGISNEDLEHGLFFLREGSGAMSCRMRVNGMHIEDAAFELKSNQAIIFDSSCVGVKLKNVAFLGVTCCLLCCDSAICVYPAACIVCQMAHLASWDGQALLHSKEEDMI